jgi:hypothetical protein
LFVITIEIQIRRKEIKAQVRAICSAFEQYIGVSSQTYVKLNFLLSNSEHEALDFLHIANKSKFTYSKSRSHPQLNPVPEIIDPVFAKTSPKRSFSMTAYERFGLVFTKTRIYKFGHWSIGAFVLYLFINIFNI